MPGIAGCPVLTYLLPMRTLTGAGAAISALICIAASSLAACTLTDGVDAVAQDAGTTTVTVTMTEGTGNGQQGKRRGPEPVDPAAFAMEGGYHQFLFTTGGDRRGVCTASSGGVSCTGRPPSGLPRQPGLPFENTSAVSIDASGVHATVIEGLPPTDAWLRAGQRVDFGEASCSQPAKTYLVCTYRGTTMIVRGGDQAISVDGPRTSTPRSTAASAGAAGSDDAGTWCGTVTDYRGRRVRIGVATGTADCATAKDIMGRYLAMTPDGAHGNTFAMEIDGWECSSPTAARARELGYDAVCDGPDGSRIGARH